MKKINFEKLNFLMNKKKNSGQNNNVEFSKEQNNNLDLASNYQDTDQIIEFCEKTLPKHYSKNKK
jgi:hypothetical protein